MALRKLTVPKTVSTAAKVAAPATKTPAPKTAAKPSVPMHSIKTDWSGPSKGVNSRVSRTPIDPAVFGTLPDAAMTERDRKNLIALKAAFGGKQFQRQNLDAGILRRLGERGFIEHVSGGSNEATAIFKLTNKKLAA